VTQRYIHRQADAINRVFGTPQPPLGTKLGTPRKWKEEVDLGNQESDDAQVRIVSGLVGAGDPTPKNWTVYDVSFPEPDLLRKRHS
jgi:hypothetical protein